MSQEKFCLKWNDFERNISSAFKEIREDRELLDITIACEDEQLEAHKVVLSACSPFFRQVLRRNRHQHPLLYLKGVSFRDMTSVLNFMYYGEVNVAQDDLNSFLQVAEDLKVKGLTQNISQSDNSKKSHEAAPVSKTRSESDFYSGHKSKSINPASDQRKSFSSSPSPTMRPPPSSLPYKVSRENDIEEIAQVVKSEPHEIHTIQETRQNQSQHESITVAQDNQQMLMTMDTEQYDDDYNSVYDGSYEVNEYDGLGSGGHEMNAQQQGEAKSKCAYCDGWFHKRSMSRHIERKHSVPMTIVCDMCEKVFASNVNLKEHYRRDHGMSTRGKY